MVLYLRRANDGDIASIKAEPSTVSAFFFAPKAADAGDLVDFDKAWQALHFTLTGAEYYTDNPLGMLLFDGEKIGEDMGYGPGWIVPARNVAEFSSALAGLTDDQLRDRYDPAGMVASDVYQAESFVEHPEEGWHYMMQSVPALRAFASKCVSTGSSVIAAIC